MFTMTFYCLEGSSNMNIMVKHIGYLYWYCISEKLQIQHTLLVIVEVALPFLLLEFVQIFLRDRQY